MSTSDQQTTEAEGLAIFEDVHEVQAEAAGVVGLQLAAVVVSYSVVLAIVVVVVVIVVLAITLFWPFLVAALFPGLYGLVTAFG